MKNKIIDVLDKVAPPDVVLPLVGAYVVLMIRRAVAK